MDAAQMLADVATAYLLNARARDEARMTSDRFRYIALHDDLTGLPNRLLLQQDFCATVASVLARTGMDPTALVLEITEHIFVEDSELAITVLVALKALGIRHAVDDFGTRYSLLSYLRRLPIDIVKIDQSFIADIDHAPGGGAILAAVTNLAHVLGFTVTAEGVETKSQRDEVSAVGCEFAQGFFYARPMAASAIGARLGAQAQSPLHLPTSHDAVAGAR